MKRRVIILCFAGMFFLCSCAPAAATSTAVERTATKVPASATPTVRPSSTPIPTITPTPSQTPDLFLDLSTCHTWREAREKCVVNLDDLKSGRLVDYAISVTAPFPEDAWKIDVPNMVYFNEDATFQFKPLAETKEDELYLKRGERGPFSVNTGIYSTSRSPVGEKLIFWLKGNGTNDLYFDSIVLIEKIHNRDATEGYLTLIYNLPTMDWNRKIMELIIDDWLVRMAYQPPLYKSQDYLGEGDKWNSKYKGRYIWLIANDYSGTDKKLMDEWMKTGIIPNDLEKRPLLPLICDGKDFGWAKY